MDQLLLLLLVFLLPLPCIAFCLWAAKKAGIRPTSYSYYKKLFYDNRTGVLDSRTSARHRSCFCSKKGGRRSIEVTQSRGAITLEFYTADGQSLQTWRTGDPAAFTVELPPGARVYWRADLNHFTGSICFFR